MCSTVGSGFSVYIRIVFLVKKNEDYFHDLINSDTNTKKHLHKT